MCIRDSLVMRNERETFTSISISYGSILVNSFSVEYLILRSHLHQMQHIGVGKFIENGFCCSLPYYISSIGFED